MCWTFKCYCKINHLFAISGSEFSVRNKGAKGLEGKDGVEKSTFLQFLIITRSIQKSFVVSQSGVHGVK